MDTQTSRFKGPRTAARLLTMCKACPPINPPFKERTTPTRGRRSSTTIPAVLSSQRRVACAFSFASNKRVSKGYRVNWRSYERQSRPEPQYAAQAAAPVRQAAAPVRQAAAPVRQAAHRRVPAPQQAPEPAPQYKHFGNAPPQIQQLLQFQQQIPYINVIPEHFR